MASLDPSAAFDLEGQLLGWPAKIKSPLARWGENEFADVRREFQRLDLVFEGIFEFRHWSLLLLSGLLRGTTTNRTWSMCAKVLTCQEVSVKVLAESLLLSVPIKNH